MYVKSILFLMSLLILAASPEVKGQADIGMPFIQSYSKTAYQAGSQNWNIIQDDRGVIYIGNQEGLLEFDGTEWNLYKIGNQTIVRSLAFYQEKIYAGGQGDLGYFYPDQSGRLAYHSLLPEIPKAYRDFDDVWNICATEHGIFFNSFSAVFQWVDGKMITHLPQKRFDFLLENRQELYIIDWEHGLLTFNGDKFELVKGGERFKNTGIASILQFNESRDMVITYNEGLIAYAPLRGFSPWTTPFDGFLTKNTAYRGLKLRDNRFVIGTSNQGLIVLDSNLNVVHHVTEGKGLENRSILGLFQDFQGNLWIGSNNGVAMMEIESPFLSIDDRMGLPGAGYTSILFDGKLYLGTDLGAYYADLTLSEDRIGNSNMKLVRNSTGHAYSFHAKENELFLAHHNGPFIIQQHSAHRLSSINGIWLFKDQNRADQMICGTYKGLLVLKKDKKWEVNAEVEGFEESSRFIAGGNGKYLWISHAYKGLFKVRLNSGQNAVTHVNRYGAQHGFPSDVNINVFEIGKELVFTGEHGVFKYDSLNDGFVQDNRWANIFSPGTQIKRLTTDHEGNIWFITGESFGKVVKEDSAYVLETQVFGKLNQKLIAGFEHINVLENNVVVLGTDHGFVLYDPKRKRQPKSPFNTLIRHVEIISQQDSTLYPGYRYAWGRPLSQSSVTIPEFIFKQNSLKFSFTGIFYEDPEKIAYSYYLEGFDPKWSGWGQNPEKEYTNLPEGTYNFHVKAKNIYGDVSTPSTFTFVILPPWYRTTLAYVLIALSLSGMSVLMLYRVRNKHHREKEKLKMEQAKTLKKKESEFASINKKNREEIMRLKNEKLETEVLHKNKELATSTMHIIHNNELLGQIKSKLLSVRQVIKTQRAREDLNKLIKLIEKETNPHIDWKQFEVHFDKSHENYLKRLREKYPQLTYNDLKLCAYLRMGLSTKEIAGLLNLSVRGVETGRYRLRKKIGIDASIDLVTFLMGI